MFSLIKFVAEHCPKSIADWLIMRHDHDVADNTLYFHLAYKRIHDMQWQSHAERLKTLETNVATCKERELFNRCCEMVQY
jgi:hypothetical protein